MSHAQDCHGEGGIVYMHILLKMTSYGDLRHMANQGLDDCRMSSFCPVIDTAWPLR